MGLSATRDKKRAAREEVQTAKREKEALIRSYLEFANLIDFEHPLIRFPDSPDGMPQFRDFFRRFPRFLEYIRQFKTFKEKRDAYQNFFQVSFFVNDLVDFAG